MQSFITGYQYGNKKQYIGEYVFETHAEFSPYVPPNTTLVPPPAISEGQEAIWNGSTWTLSAKAEVSKLQEVSMVKPEIPVIPVPAIVPLTEEELKSHGA